MQEELTLRNLWKSGFSVIVSYEHSITSCHSELWPHIPYWWANKCKAEALIEAFENRKKHDRPGTLLYCTPTLRFKKKKLLKMESLRCRPSYFACAIVRGLLCDGNESHSGPEVHLHTPDRVPEGPGDVHQP